MTGPAAGGGPPLLFIKASAWLSGALLFAALFYHIAWRQVPRAWDAESSRINGGLVRSLQASVTIAMAASLVVLLESYKRDVTDGPFRKYANRFALDSRRRAFMLCLWTSKYCFFH